MPAFQPFTLELIPSTSSDTPASTPTSTLTALRQPVEESFQTLSRVLDFKNWCFHPVDGWAGAVKLGSHAHLLLRTQADEPLGSVFPQTTSTAFADRHADNEGVVIAASLWVLNKLHLQ
eukprot:1161719-Pelagomonas_calceolata.AAC.10